MWAVGGVEESRGSRGRGGADTHRIGLSYASRLLLPTRVLIRNIGGVTTRLPSLHSRPPRTRRPLPRHPHLNTA